MTLNFEKGGMGVSGLKLLRFSATLCQESTISITVNKMKEKASFSCAPVWVSVAGQEVTVYV